MNDQCKFNPTANYENASALFRQYKDDPEMCATIIRTIVWRPLGKIDDPENLIKVFQETQFYKKKPIPKPVSVSNLDTVEAIHLVLSVDNPELYGRLYNLYLFQNSIESSDRLLLIREAKADPEVTEKQIEICALESHPEEIEYLLGNFINTTYYQINKKDDYVSVTPFHLLVNIAQLNQRTDALNLCPLISDLNIRERLTLSCIYAVWETMRNRLNLQLELLKQLPKKKFDRYLPILKEAEGIFSTLEKHAVPLFNIEAKMLEEVREHLRNPELPPKIPTHNVISWSIKNKWKRDEIKSSLENCIIELHQNTGSQTYLSMEMNSEIWSCLTDTSNVLDHEVKPFYCCLDLPEQANGWKPAEEKLFIDDFRKLLGFETLPFAAFSFCNNNVKTFHIFIKTAIIKNKIAYPVSVVTIPARMHEILHQLELKYKLLPGISEAEEEKNTQVIKRNISDTLKDTPSVNLSDNKKLSPKL